MADAELDQLSQAILNENAGAGGRMVQGALRALGYRVQRSRIRESMMRIDPLGTAQRFCSFVPRRTYSVRSSNSLWHLGNLTFITT